MASSTEVIERLVWPRINTCWSTINMQDSSAFSQKSCLCRLTVDLLPLVRADLFHRYSQAQFNAGRSRQKSCPTFPKGVRRVLFFPLRAAFLKSANTPAQRCSLSAACRQQGSHQRVCYRVTRALKVTPCQHGKRFQLPLDLLTIPLSWLSSMSKEPTALAEQRPAGPNQTNLQL